MKYQALNYQKDGIRFGVENPRCAIFADPGGGKTAMTLAIIKLLKKQQKINRVLIVAPRLVCYDVWPKECEKWDQFKDLKCRILHGDEKAQALFQEVIDPKADICLINPEMVKYLFSFFPPKWFNRKTPPIDWPWDMLIIDESSKFKNPSSQRFKAIKQYHKLFPWIIELTGTPTPNSLMDLWSQIYLLDSGEALGKNITAFRRKYFEIANPHNPQFNQWQLKYGADKLIQKAVKHLVIRFDESMFAELPELVFNEIPLTLPTKAMNYYKSIEKDMFAEMEGQETFVSSASGKYLLCRQIANGRHYDPEDKSKITKVHDVKIECLKNLVDELQGKPLLVAYYFKHDLDALREAFPKLPNIGSETSTKQITEHLSKWNKGELPILAVHPDSMSHGLNMQSGGTNLFYYSLTNSLESFLQLNKRLHRRGARGNVMVHLPIAKSTVDVAIMRALRNKDADQRALLDSLLEYKKENCRGADRFRI